MYLLITNETNSLTNMHTYRNSRPSPCRQAETTEHHLLRFLHTLFTTSKCIFLVIQARTVLVKTYKSIALLSSSADPSVFSACASFCSAFVKLGLKACSTMFCAFVAPSRSLRDLSRAGTTRLLSLFVCTEKKFIF